MDANNRFQFRRVAIGLMAIFWSVAFQVPAHGITVDFGASGLYDYPDGGDWHQLSPSNAEWLGTYDDKLVGDFGALGLYEYDGFAWTRIAFANADNSGNTMVAFNGGLAVDIGAGGGGVWYYKDGSWSKISSNDVEWLGTYSDKLVGDFGAYGLYEYDGAAWTRIAFANADNSGNTMVAYDNDGLGVDDGLAVDVGTGGLWYYRGGSWSQLSPANPQWLQVYREYMTDPGGLQWSFPLLAVDFGAFGLWSYGGGWGKISTSDADNSGNTMVNYKIVEDGGWFLSYGGIAVDFGDSGLWTNDRLQGWKKLSSINPQWLKVHDSTSYNYHNYLTIDFGASGLYLYDNFTSTVDRWEKLSTGDADNSGNTMIDW